MQVLCINVPRASDRRAALNPGPRPPAYNSSIYEINSSQSSAVLPIVRNGIHAEAITQSFHLLRARVSMGR